MGSIKVNRQVLIDENEVILTFSRSSGPGGQKVNKASTRVTLRFDVTRSGSLSERQKQRIKKRLSGRVSKDGVLRVASQKYRTQAANRREVLDRFVELIQAALKRREPRKRTKAPEWTTERRLRDKKSRSRLKEQRSLPAEPDD
jgi:ribosome-associated protein